MSRYYERDEFFRRGRDGGGSLYDRGEGDDFESMNLLPEPSSARPRSIPADASAVVRREHSISRSWSRSRSRSRRSRSRGLRLSRSRSRSWTRSRARTPLSRARDVVEDNFTSSTAGIGASILGAVVGGFVASRASEALQQQQQQRRRRDHKCDRRYSDDSATNVPRIASAVLGAVAGGLGANALTNRLEDSRDRDRQLSWERRYGRNSWGRSHECGDDECDYVYEDDRQYERRRRSSDVRYRN